MLRIGLNSRQGVKRCGHFVLKEKWNVTQGHGESISLERDPIYHDPVAFSIRDMIWLSGGGEQGPCVGRQRDNQPTVNDNRIVADQKGTDQARRNAWRTWRGSESPGTSSSSSLDLILPSNQSKKVLFPPPASFSLAHDRRQTGRTNSVFRTRLLRERDCDFFFSLHIKSSNRNWIPGSHWMRPQMIKTAQKKIIELSPMATRPISRGKVCPPSHIRIPSFDFQDQMERNHGRRSDGEIMGFRQRLIARVFPSLFLFHASPSSLFFLGYE